MYDNKSPGIFIEKTALKHFFFLIIICALLFGAAGCGKKDSIIKSAAAASASKLTTAAQSIAAQASSDNIINRGEKNTVIVIDPGHGSRINRGMEPISPGSKDLKAKNTIGAVGIYTKTPEYKIAFDVGLKLKKVLEDRGYKVIMTKDSTADNPSNIERAEVGNKNNAGLVVRIHADSSTNSSIKGTSILIPAGINEGTKKIKNESEECAKIILNELTAKAGARGRGIVERKDLTGFNWSRVPVVLIEMGFLSNKQEDILLNNEQNQNKITKAIAAGIEKYLIEKARKAGSN